MRTLLVTAAIGVGSAVASAAVSAGAAALYYRHAYRKTCGAVTTSHSCVTHRRERQAP